MTETIEDINKQIESIQKQERALEIKKTKIVNKQKREQVQEKVDELNNKFKGKYIVIGNHTICRCDEVKLINTGNIDKIKDIYIKTPYYIELGRFDPRRYGEEYGNRIGSIYLTDNEDGKEKFAKCFCDSHIELLSESEAKKEIQEFVGKIQLMLEEKVIDNNPEPVEQHKTIQKEEFNAIIDKAIKQMPSSWRNGQKVFNAIDNEFGVARTVQFQCGVDCFYDDSKIEEFKEKAYEVVNRKNDRQTRK